MSTPQEAIVEATQQAQSLLFVGNTTTVIRSPTSTWRWCTWAGRRFCAP
ncbi:MAG TPA: hypothetical protein VKP11_03575 [Frankiaceae bacterium]|nr:hypothetical protein [Frankiaceae bacterium]